MVSNLESFWKGKSVFITGAAGFKGSWLSYWLTLLGAKVSGISLRTAGQHSLFDSLSLSNLINFSENNICDLHKLTRSIEEANPDIVFHLAAQPLVLESYKSPVETFSSNVMGTVNVLETCRNLPNLKSVIVVTSDKCYKVDSQETFFSEDRELGGNDPYSASKACTELVTNSYSKSFFDIHQEHCAISTVRAGNVIGGGDWSKNRIMTDIVMAAFEKQKLVIRNPLATRPWQHVLDPLFGYIELARKQYFDPKNYKGPWNFAPPVSHCKNVDWIVSRCNSFSRNTITAEYVAGNHEETTFLTVNAEKANKKLDWSISWDIEHTIEKTIEWYEHYYSGKNVRDLCEKQIYQFSDSKDENQ